MAATAKKKKSKKSKAVKNTSTASLETAWQNSRK
jgi:hypothetical protein